MPRPTFPGRSAVASLSESRDVWLANFSYAAVKPDHTHVCAIDSFAHEVSMLSCQTFVLQSTATEHTTHVLVHGSEGVV